MARTVTESALITEFDPELAAPSASCAVGRRDAFNDDIEGSVDHIWGTLRLDHVGTKAARKRARQAVKRAENGMRLLEKERPKDPGDDSEPDRCV